MTIVVLDASIALAAVLPEPNSLVARAILARIVDEGAVVPMLWPLEVVNSLLMAERRQSIQAGDHTKLLRWQMILSLGRSD